jgi:hypothetical protein
VHVLEIGGNSEDVMQLEIIVKEKNILKDLKNCDILFDFKYPVGEQDPNFHIAVGVKIKDILNFIRLSKTIDGLKIHQIYDYLFK